jgi:hypothetical protein
MLDVASNQRICNRRSSRGGGRRAADRPALSADVPTCPMCLMRGVASLAGESEGGWWFVCLACDHLWDQRQVHHRLVAAER